MEKLRIIIGGFIGLYPTGGVTWDYIQYPLGFHLLGHDIFYLEDTGQYSFYKSPGKAWNDPTDTIDYLQRTMKKFGLDGRWAYRDVATGDCYGMSLAKLREICDTADLFINISASTIMRAEYMSIPRRMLIDSDPMFTQIQDWDDNHVDQSIHAIKETLGNYTHLFSFGENIGREGCRIPTFGFRWHVTRQPICMDCWRPAGIAMDPKDITTVMNWATTKKIIYRQEQWGQKDVEFEKIMRLPLLVKNATFTVIAADNSKQMDSLKLRQHGWTMLDPLETISTADDYKKFIHSSLAEFSVAKETYVKSRSGWFSCRSGCYLASGKPVVTQDTGWSAFIPSGSGLIGFDDLPSAVSALEAVMSNYHQHANSAVEIANEYFNADKVLSQLIEVSGRNDLVSDLISDNEKEAP